VNLCTGCGEDFGSVSAFDAHRVGKFRQRGPSAYTGPLADWQPEKGRRCLTPAELLEDGWTRDSRGRWRRRNDGAPWATSQDQVTTQTPCLEYGKARRHLQRHASSRRLPASQKAGPR